jgi:hypothetical protein
MKKLMATALLVCISLAFTQCSDKGGDDPTPPNPCSETALAVTTTPGVNTTTPPQVGEDFPITINITAGFPAAGATINVSAKNETTNAQFFEANPSNVTAGVNNVTITKTPAGANVVVQITVTSKNCATNKWTGTLRYSRK